MFGDNDRDGVANVFDCKPNNPYDQGIISAIVGAVKGWKSGTGARAGWREGMAKPGVYRQIRTRMAERRFERQRPKIISKKVMSPRELAKVVQQVSDKDYVQYSPRQEYRVGSIKRGKISKYKPTQEEYQKELFKKVKEDTK
jgi:hypothetical protein